MHEEPKRYSWNQPICFDCFQRRDPGRMPVRIREDAYDDFEAMIATCVDCGRLTIDCIWMRVDPEEAHYPSTLKDEE